MLTTSTDSGLENSIKALLQEMLVHLEQLIDDQGDLQSIESMLQDYENLEQLVETTQNIFKILMRRLNDGRKEKFFKSETKSYVQLERMIQKHEQEIREHIRIQNELRLYAEQISQQLEESESIRNDFLKETTRIITELKRENNEQSLQLKEFKSQISVLEINSKRQTGYNIVSNIIQRQQTRLKQKQQLFKDSSVQQFNALCKLSGKDTSKTGRQTLRTYTRNKSFSVGVSKQSSASTSFNKIQETSQNIKLLSMRKKSFQSGYRASLYQLKQIYK
ncbi:hypothetical protein pb186bvf_008391 [Paramecium bursaria]